MDPSSVAQMLSNPAMQQAMDQMLSNPQMIEQAMASNPTLRSMADSNPQMRSLLQNPEALRAMLQPQSMQTMLSLNQAMGQMQGPGLPGAMPGMGMGMGVPSPTSAPAPPYDGPTLQLDDLFQRFGVTDPLSTGATTGPTGSAPVITTTASSTPTPAASTATPATRSAQYANQLAQMESMGFSDKESNLRALEQCGGNINAAIEKVLSSS
jgi:ubiquilin